MKPIESDKVIQLLELLEKKPAQRIVHFTTSSHIVSKHLHQFSKTYDSDYYLYISKDVFYDKSMTKYASQDNIHIFKFDIQSPRYTMETIKFDYLIVTLGLIKEEKETFLKKSSSLLRAEGSIIMIIPKGIHPEHDSWRELLIAPYYDTVSTLDDMFEHYDVIITKRM
jgi:hypothetical protein